MPVSASATTLTLLCLLAAAGAAPPADDIVSRVRHHNFGMYSYSYTQSTSATTELTAFAKKYGLRDILQYVCGGIHLMPPGRFANFVNRVGEGSGATVTAMFDRTQWGTDTSPYSIVAKLKWYKAVRSILIGTYNNHYSLAGVTFDIEDLSPQHYVTLTSYAEDQWNTLVPRDAWAHETISFQLGSKEDSTAAKIVSGDIVDRIYWENYRNTEAEVFDFADNMLNQVDPTGNGEAVLAVNTICCLPNPCSNEGARSFPEKAERSFCRQNAIPGGGGAKMSPEYMLDTLDQVRDTLYKKYPLVLRNLPFYVYDYRAFKVFLEGQDAVHATTCPAFGLPEIAVSEIAAMAVEA
jgi:hypothetical protein